MSFQSELFLQMRTSIAGLIPKEYIFLLVIYLDVHSCLKYSSFFFKEITFIQQEYIKLIKSDSKVLLKLSIRQRILKLSLYPQKY